MATPGFYRKSDCGACDSVELTKQACARLAVDICRRRANSIQKLTPDDSPGQAAKEETVKLAHVLAAEIEHAIVREMTGDPCARLRQAFRPLRGEVAQKAERDVEWERLALAIAAITGDAELVKALAVPGGLLSGVDYSEAMAGAAGFEPATPGLEIPCSGPAELRARKAAASRQSSVGGQLQFIANCATAAIFGLLCLFTGLSGQVVHALTSAGLAFLFFRERRTS